MAKPPIRILHLITRLTTGGIERWLLNMLREVERERYQMDICCKGDSVGQLAPIAEALGARVWHIPLDWTHVRYAYKLQALVRKQEYDIIHNHLAVYAGMPALIAHRLHVPTILSFHNTDLSTDLLLNPVLRGARDIYSQFSIPLAIRFATALTGCSEDVIRTIVDTYDAANVKTRVLYYGVDIPPSIDTRQHSIVRCEIGVPEHAPLILHIGRFAPQKNHLELLEIGKRLLKRHPTTMFVLVGDGVLRPTIESEICTHHLSAHFRVLGARQDVERLLGAADILLLPSVWEGFGLVAIEAGAAGIPVVGSDIPGLREAIEDQRTGILVPLNSTDAFVDVLDMLICSADLRARLGAAGRQHVLNKFSSRASAQELCKLYDESVALRP